MKIVIKGMEVEHLEQVAVIEASIFSRPWTKENFKESIDLEDTRYLVAVEAESGQVLGYCGYYKSFEEANITNVAVSKEARRCGVAYELLTALMEIGKKQDITLFWLEVRESNQAAKALYEKLGFAQIGVRKNFYADPVEHACIMQCQC